MPGPKLFDCGGPNQPACPPTPALAVAGTNYYSEEQVQNMVPEAYQKGRVDERMVNHPGDK